MQPAQAMIKMQNNKQMNDMWESIMLFVNEVMTFSSIIDYYQGSDFCQGLMFGTHGARLIIAGGKQLLSMQ